MKDLVFAKNDDLFTDSLTIAKVFNRQHGSVMNTIKGLVDDMNASNESVDDVKIIKTTYVQDQNKQRYTMYVVNQLAFALVANRLHGRDAFKFQLMYNRAFKQLADQKSKSRFVEKVQPKSNKLYTTTKLAKNWGMSAHEMHTLLRDWGYLEYDNYNDCWELSEFYKQYDYTKTVRGTNYYGTAYNSMRWTDEGAAWVRKIMIDNGQGGTLKERNGDRKMGVADKPKPKQIKNAFQDLF